jgi:hypothetical protein
MAESVKRSACSSEDEEDFGGFSSSQVRDPGAFDRAGRGESRKRKKKRKKAKSRPGMFATCIDLFV